MDILFTRTADFIIITIIFYWNHYIDYYDGDFFVFSNTIILPKTLPNTDRHRRRRERIGFSIFSRAK